MSKLMIDGIDLENVELSDEMAAALFGAFSSKFAKAKKETSSLVGANTSSHFKGRIVFDADVKLNRGEDTERTPTTSLPLKYILCKLFKMAGFQKENMKQFIIDAWAEFEESDEDKLSEIMEDTDKAMSEVTDMLKTLPKVPTKGSMRVERCDIRFVKVEPKKSEILAEEPVAKKKK